MKNLKKHKIFGTGNVPRLAVFRSNKYIYAQLIDDQTATTIVSAHESKKNKVKKGKIEIAREIGADLAKKAAAKKIRKVVFDRRGYKYHGRVKALAEGARVGGLIF